MVRANGCVELQYSTPASRHCGYTANTDRCQTNRAWLNVHLSESPVWTTDCKCFHGHLGTFTPAAAAVVGLASPCGTVSYRQCQRRCVFAFINAPFWLRASSSQIPSSVLTYAGWDQAVMHQTRVFDFASFSISSLHGCFAFIKRLLKKINTLCKPRLLQQGRNLRGICDHTTPFGHCTLFARAELS